MLISFGTALPSTIVSYLLAPTILYGTSCCVTIYVIVSYRLDSHYYHIIISLQITARSELYILYYTMLNYTTLYYNILQYTTIWCTCNIVHHMIWQYDMYHSMLRESTLLSYIMLPSSDVRSCCSLTYEFWCMPDLFVVYVFICVCLSVFCVLTMRLIKVSLYYIVFAHIL